MSEEAPISRRATMADVAQVAGVSRGTVSRYLNNTSYVSAAARKSIADAIDTIGYVPNAAARSLAGSPSRNVAFIVHEQANLFAEDPNLVGMMVGANRMLVKRDHQLLVMLAGDDSGITRIARTLAGGLIDGVMLASTRVQDPLVDLVTAAKVPAAIVGRPDRANGVPSVDVDNVEGARMITKRLLQTGRRRPAILAGPKDMRAALDRLQGYRSAAGPLADARLIRHTADWSFHAGKSAMAELLAVEPKVDAVFGACDAIAAGAIEALTVAGRKVPRDVGVVGFDDAPWAAHSTPGLSTVSQPTESLGERIAEFVIRQLDGEDLTGAVSIENTEVVWRESA